MDQVEIAKICGLCAGCTNAIGTTLRLIDEGKDVVLFKEIVHNKNVNKMLKERGAEFCENLSDLKSEKTVLIRAHGEPKSTFEFLEKNNIDFADCTCIKVKQIHSAVEKFYNLGYRIILIGKYGKKSNVMHPEVFGTLGYCDNNAILIEDEDDLKKISRKNGEKYYLVCQTTFKSDAAEDLIEKIRRKLQPCELVVNKSLCSFQNMILDSSRELAKTKDITIVVGGANSSNSYHLYSALAKDFKTIFIEDINSWQSELYRANIAYDKSSSFCLTAGASTQREELADLKNLILQYIGDKN